MQKIQYTTSRGHLSRFPHPPQVGVGWGDYDLFSEWQAHGREVKKSMVEDKEWSKSRASPLVFVDGNVITEDPNCFDCLESTTTIEPETLFEQLNKENGSKRLNREGNFGGDKMGGVEEAVGG